MKTYLSFTESCEELLKIGYDRSDNEQTAYLQDLYAQMNPNEIAELFTENPNYFTVLAWVMGGAEVARVASQLAKDKARAEYSAKLAEMGNAHKTQIDELLQQLDTEREDHVQTIKAKQDMEQKINGLEMDIVGLDAELNQSEMAFQTLNKKYKDEVKTWADLHASAIEEMEKARTEARRHRANAERAEAERATTNSPETVAELKTQLRALTLYAQSLER